MDGLDSRGQVVLIGATNRIDAIDGALRRPGRFDREFTFPLPGCKARAEILDIHTRKWKEPPSKELKGELAASCVGYCGADLKALCTEAAIRAFREKYPQVYTSDEKFVIDVNSINVQKYHFLEAMSTITPAAHRGSIVHSRPLSPIVSSFLLKHVQRIMTQILDIFPFLSNSEMNTLSVCSYGPAIPLVYRPRLLICADDSSGLDHVGPAVLHELEKFPVHSLGLPSLLSDPSAKTPEEALVHIFSEARRTTPSVLFLPQFQLWWETAHEQLKAVLMTLLEELPSQLPILLLGTSSEPLLEIDGNSTPIFAPRNIYTVDRPTKEDRYRFVEQIIETVLSIPMERSSIKNKESDSLPELPKAPKEVSGPKVSELRAKAEAEQHSLRRLRMCLRDVCNRILYDKRFSVFHYPVSDEDAPNYRTIIQNPMDVATILQRVDSGLYITRSSFIQDVDLIVSNARAYNGDDYSGARIVSRAFELRDVVQGMLSQMDPALISSCEKIAEQGGPSHMPDDVGGLCIPSVPVAQTTAVTRSSARLRNAQPEVNLSQSYEALKRTRKNIDNEQIASNAEDRSKYVAETEPSKASSNLSSAQEADADESLNPTEAELTEASGMASCAAHEDVLLDSEMNESEFTDQISSVKRRLMERTEGYGAPLLERLYCRLVKGVLEMKSQGAILRFLLDFVDDEENF
ncbi:hypothetical protein HPP92_008867 [Vanilla planifolia]|uniref:Bromo domain-containing protein n=1 Tax=Vanilla planifolia TaxID=51239 RepID=A0A835V630_VANPL|nr:hypothetical protein HPP92_008867 [Vanilla planifolia]